MQVPDRFVPHARTHRHAAIPPVPSRRGRLLVTGGVVAALGLGALVPMVGSSFAQDKRRIASQGFEAGTGSWVAAGRGATLTPDSDAHTGSGSARIATSTGGWVAMRDRPNLVRRTTDGRYVVTAWVKAVRPGMTAVLRVREIDRVGESARTVDVTRVRTRLVDVRWHRLVVRVSPAAGHTLGLAVLGAGMRATQAMLVDDVVVRRAVRSGGGATPQHRGNTLFGVAYWPKGGESNDQALARSDAQLGRSHIVRIFYPGLPVAWPGAAGRANRPVVVSFKALPRDIIAGRYDSQLQAWFRQAPSNRDIYWSYYHEPEDNIEAGQFTAAQYRAAWTRIHAMAEAARNPHLISTLILMGWTADPSSRRNWRDYYAGDKVIDAFGWDSYNEGSSPRTDGRRSYYSPQQMFAKAVAVSRAQGKPFGFAEWGSLMVPGDDGSGRAAWIRASTRYMTRVGAAFGTYFDTPVDGEYRLLDRPSQQAMRSVLTRSG